MYPSNNQPKIEYDNQEVSQTIHSFKKETPSFASWIVNHSGGKIQNENIANYILLGFAFIIFAISIFIFLGMGNKSGKAIPPQSTPGLDYNLPMPKK